MVGGVENRGAMQELGHSVYEKYLYLPLSIAVNVKLFNKSKIFFKKSKNLKKMKGYVTFTFDIFLWTTKAIHNYQDKKWTWLETVTTFKKCFLNGL